MQKQVSSGLKYTFLAHAIVALVLGLGILLIPDTVSGWISWPLGETFFIRLAGAAILGFAASSFWAYSAEDFAQVRIVVLMEIVWTVLGTLVYLWGLLIADPRIPSIGWVFAIILALFAVAFGYFYFRE
ncbi:MAG: hypothetical protein JW910_23100 [Anaerolineae bacterium]|nr:hypothetical protein [Anaerolineae bacterium]